MSLGGRVCRAFLDCYFNNTSITAPANVYISLHTGDPGEDGQGANEVSGNNYARISTSASDWTAASGADPAALSNSSALESNVATGSWGTITHVGLWDHATNTAEANFIGGSPIDTSRAIASGEKISIAIGEIDVTAD